MGGSPVGLGFLPLENSMVWLSPYRERKGPSPYSAPPTPSNLQSRETWDLGGRSPYDDMGEFSSLPLAHIDIGAPLSLYGASPSSTFLNDLDDQSMTPIHMAPPYPPYRERGSSAYPYLDRAPTPPSPLYRSIWARGGRAPIEIYRGPDRAGECQLYLA